MLNKFAIFIMVYGRPDKMWTYKSLRRAGYTGKIYLVADDLDERGPEYKEKYGDELIIFDKVAASKKMDAGDNFRDYRSTLFSANTIPELAKGLGLKHFMIMCDDYTAFSYKFDTEGNFQTSSIKSLDRILAAMIEFYDTVPMLTIALAQTGDFIGGKNGGFASDIKLTRKAMNTFLCGVDKPIKFMGKLNEDVTTYINLGGRGELFFTANQVAIQQQQHQKQKGGLTEIYLEGGTYVKSFYSVMYNPSCIKVGEMGEKHKRIHHSIRWNNAIPKILNEDQKK